MHLSGPSFQGLTPGVLKGTPMGDPITGLQRCSLCPAWLVDTLGICTVICFGSSLPSQKPMYSNSPQQLWEVARISGWIPAIQGRLQVSDWVRPKLVPFRNSWKASVLSPPLKFCSSLCQLRQCFARLLTMSSKPEHRVLEKARTFA